jgi:hypothetical protein
MSASSHSFEQVDVIPRKTEAHLYRTFGRNVFSNSSCAEHHPSSPKRAEGSCERLLRAAI